MHTIKSKRSYHLFSIGLLMGICDLIPGVSGGTIAFICGIYDQFLASIKTLSFHTFNKIAWPFLLPLGLGIGTSILLFSRLVSFFLINYKSSLFGFFFGLILASTLICLREVNLKKSNQSVALGGGLILAVTLSLFPTYYFFCSNFFGIILAGILGTGAMLLPGISGSFILQVIGIYPLVISALAEPTAPSSLKLLSALGIGISIGFIFFSRLISFLLLHFYQFTFAVLVGFMVGGLKTLWPFESQVVLPLFLSLCGFFLVILLEVRGKRLKSLNSIK